MSDDNSKMSAWRVPVSIDRQFRRAGSGLVHYRQLGHGPVVGLLHDLPGSGRLVEDQMVALAAQGYCVLAPDLPGWGLSDDTVDPLGALSSTLCGYAPIAIIAWSGSAVLAEQLAAKLADAKLVAIISRNAINLTPPPFQEDGGHLDILWTHAVEFAVGNISRAQKVLAEWMSACPKAWHDLAIAPPQAAPHEVPQFDCVEDAIPDLKRWFEDQIQHTRIFHYGLTGRLHLRISRPLGKIVHPPLICLHASPLSGVVFEPLMHKMATDRLVIAPDTPGFGESDAPDRPLSIPELADALLSVLKQFMIGPVDLFGFHTGAMIAAELAAAHPNRFRRIAMISAPLFTDAEKEWFRNHYTAKPELADGSHNKERWQMFWNWRGPRQSIENYARNHAQGMRGGPAYHWGHRAAFDHDFAGCLALLNQPVLILNPADDLAELTRRAIGQMPRGDIIELPDCGHGMLDSDTELVAQYLRQFLDDPI